MASLTSDTNVVLKLDLGEHGGMRRIALRKLWDESTQQVSYSKLSEIALGLYISSTSPKKAAKSQDATVTVTYTDEDGDVITISTDDELAEAFEQFVNTVPPVLRARASVTGKRLKMKKGVTSTPPSVVEAKSESSDDMDKKSSDVPRRVRGATAKPSMKPSEELQNVLENFVGVLTVAVNTLTKNVPEDLSKTDEEIKKEVVESVKPKEEVACDDVTEKKKNEATDEVKEEPAQNKKKEDDVKQSIPHVPDSFDRTFIHGRHTCDSCLTTPIIGIRFNAINLPDYDLCQKCIPNYKGSHIKFAPSQLERDEHLQPRWKRRHARFVRQAEMTMNNSPRRTASSTNHSGTGTCALNIASDADLKEAIRRSLLDANQKRVAPTENVKETAEKKVDAVKEPEIAVASVVVAENVAPKVEVPEVKEESHDLELCESINKVEAAPVESAVFVTTDSVTGDESVDAVKDTDVDEAVESKPVAKESEVDDDVSLVENEDKKVNVSTFSDDAEGNGDVAAAIGHALDNCAEAIDAMIEEANKESPSKVSNSSSVGQTIIEGNPDDVKEAADDAKTVGSEDSEWQVLGSVSSHEMIAQAAQLLGSALFQSDMVEASNNSDREGAKLEHSETSTLTVPTVVPSIASKSEISTVVLSRWDDELKQLHELGFLDDHRSVEALEHLEAANMGCESDEPVTVNDAINYMMKQGN